ncbi:MAG: hypothetical protein Q8Q54_17310 [Methylococcales bacterium]|nr:hypothetical protein [Methylococcaceae bacterium]MDP3840677.1 hypothetical protein [Methylococcales bacterium]
MIAQTYNLQKKELEETRRLLEISTDAQKNQLKLAALTALLSSNLTRISLFETEKIPLLQGTLPKPKEHENTVLEIANQMRCDRSPQARQNEIELRISKIEIEIEINELKESNTKLEEQIKGFLNTY